MREIEPRLRTEDLVAGCYEPASGYCNPVETAQGFARAARARGARFLEDTEVARPSSPRATASPACRRAAGAIHAPRVVNAAGLWGARVGAMVGLEIPITRVPAQDQHRELAGGGVGGRTRWSTTSSPTSTRGRSWASTSWWAASTPRKSHDLADPDRYREGVSLDESTEALVPREPSLPRPRGGAHRARLRRLLRRHAGLAPHPGPGRPRGQLRRRGLLRPRLQALAGGGPHDGRPSSPRARAPIPTSPTFRLSRFAEGKPIRGTYGDWLMC